MSKVQRENKNRLDLTNDKSLISERRDKSSDNEEKEQQNQKQQQPQQKLQKKEEDKLYTPAGIGDKDQKIQQAEIFQKYLENTGISMAFQIIFAEILSKKIEQDKVFEYTSMRLRQIGMDIAKIQEKEKKK